MKKAWILIAALAGCSWLAGCNSAPVALDDQASVASGGATEIDVLANDTDPDADPLLVKRVWGAQLGSTSLNPDNTVTYTPKSGVTGTDYFNYRVKDNHGHAKNAQVRVDIEPARPVTLVAPDTVIRKETVVVTPPPPTTIVERERLLAAPEVVTTPAIARGPFIESLLVTLHTTADDKNREEPVRLVLRRGNEILADRTVGAGELWGSFTNTNLDLRLSPQVPASDASRLVLDVRKAPVGTPSGGGWTVQTEARAKLSDGTTRVVLPMTDPVKLGDDAPPDRSWTLTSPR